MVRIASPQGVETLVSELSGKLVGGKKEQERDIASIALKTVVAELPTSADPKGVVAKTTLKLVEGLEAKVNVFDCERLTTAPSSGS